MLTPRTVRLREGKRVGPLNLYDHRTAERPGARSVLLFDRKNVWRPDLIKSWGNNPTNVPTIWILERHGLWYRNRIDRRSKRFRLISVFDDSPPDRTDGLPIAWVLSLFEIAIHESFEPPNEVRERCADLDHHRMNGTPVPQTVMIFDLLYNVHGRLDQFGSTYDIEIPDYNAIQSFRSCHAANLLDHPADEQAHA